MAAILFVLDAVVLYYIIIKDSREAILLYLDGRVWISHYYSIKGCKKTIMPLFLREREREREREF